MLLSIDNGTMFIPKCGYKKSDGSIILCLECINKIKYYQAKLSQFKQDAEEELKKREVKLEWIIKQRKEFSREYEEQNDKERCLFIDGKLTIFGLWEGNELSEIQDLKSALELIKGEPSR